MNRYGFQLEKFSSLIPGILRKSRLKSLLQSLLIPLKSLYDMFMTFRKDKTYRLEHSGQVISLQDIIRNYCGDKRCYITDGIYVDDVRVPYDGAESLVNYQISVPYDGNSEPQVQVMYRGLEDVTQSDFIVHLPEELRDDIDNTGLTALIDGYKLAGKYYRIIYEQM